MIPVFSILFSFALPIFAMAKYRRDRPLKRPYFFSVASFVFCSVGIIAEIFTIKRRLLTGDIGGIEDTIGAVLVVCVVFLVVTTLLNLFLLAFSYEKDEANN